MRMIKIMNIAIDLQLIDTINENFSYLANYFRALQKSGTTLFVQSKKGRQLEQRACYN